MSEYQYYEFQAIDRPLTGEETGELRSVSTRARITPTSFVNEYAWGRFKGDEDAWMEKYFDAFLYLANWGTRVLKLRLPSRLLEVKAAEKYVAGDSAFVREKSGKVILSFVSEDEEGGEWVEAEGLLSSLIPVRAELTRGDLRALYLGWLLCAQNREFDDEDTEPPVPPGFGQLSASLKSLAGFLRIDDDLLHIAAGTSGRLDDGGLLKREDVKAWVARLPPSEKDEVLASLIVDIDRSPVTQLLQRFLEERAGGAIATPVARRTVGELLRAAETYAEERRRIEAEKSAGENARREQEALVAKEKYLDGIAGRELKLWSEVEGLIATRQPKRYDQAVKLLVDLRDLAQHDSRSAGFDLKLEAIRDAHSGKPTFIDRLKKAGL